MRCIFLNVSTRRIKPTQIREESEHGPANLSVHGVGIALVWGVRSQVHIAMLLDTRSIIPPAPCTCTLLFRCSYVFPIFPIVLVAQVRSQVL